MPDSESSPEPMFAAGTPDLIGRLWSEFRAPVLILLAHVPLLVVHFVNLSYRPQYQHFPIVILIACGLLWTRLKPIPEDMVGPIRRKRAYALFGCSLVLLFAGTIIFSPWFAALGFVLAMGGTILILRERFELQNGLGIWLIFLLLVPLPGMYDVRLSQALQRLTTVVSGGILEQINIPNIIEGTTLSLSTRRLFIEEACSGIVSMMAIIASCLIVAVLANRPLLHSILLVISGMAWAAVTNVLRIVTLAVAQEKLGLDLSEGWRHEVLGLVLFAGALLLALSTDQLLCFIIAPIEDDEDDQFSWTIRFWDRFVTVGDPTLPSVIDHKQDLMTLPMTGSAKSFMGFAGLFLFMGLVGLGLGIGRLTASDSVMKSPTTQPLLASLNEEFLPENVGEWTRLGYEEEHVERLFAQESRVWKYQNGDLNAIFSMDFMFPSWHDLCECYRSIGWSQNGKSNLAETKAGGGDYLTAQFFKGETEEGALCFSLIEDTGAPFAPPETLSAVRQVKRRMQADRSLYQIQLWTTERGDLSDFERESAEDLFRQLRARIVRQIAIVHSQQLSQTSEEE